MIKRWREKINDPVKYDIIDGKLEVTNGKVNAQTELIKKQIKAEKNADISEEKIKFFINAIQNEVEKVDPRTLEVSAEGETPLISYCRMGGDSVELILKQCIKKFNDHELKLLRNFITEHNEHNGVMTLVVKNDFNIKSVVRKSGISEVVSRVQRITTPHS